jgi:protein-L-isoaspartate(D-aspartate) O-methyltransferase
MAQVDDAAVAEARRFFAEELRFAGGLDREEVVEAFALVPRERFLGSPPWKISSQDGSYREVPGSDPRDTYHNVVFAIDERRHLNNGQPSFIAYLIERSGASKGDHAVHVGCGTGYYTAVLAELVGASGSVTAIEVDEDLVVRARANLAAWPNVEVKQADGTLFDPGATAAILVNAGCTHPAPLWLDRLLPGGTLILPLTVNAAVHSVGWILEVTHTAEGFAARFISPVGIYPLLGARDEVLNRRLAEAFARGDEARSNLQSLRRDEHVEGADCWLHTDDFCLSMLALG